MNTICPECSSVFRITAEQLSMAHGKVRCGFCMTVFDALSSLEEDWKDNLPHADEETETRLVFTDEDVADFNKLPEGSSEPPDVYQDDEELPLDEIIANPNVDNEWNNEPEQEDNSDSFFAEDEPSALAELQSHQQARADETGKDTADQRISEQAEKLFDEIEAQFKQKEATSPEVDEAEPPAPVEVKHDDAPVVEKNKDDAPTPREVEDTIEFVMPELLPPVLDAPGILRDELEMVAAGEKRSRFVAWLAGICLLCLVFALQIIYINRNELARNESFRSTIINMCELLNCDIPMRNDARYGLKTITMNSHAIVKIPDKPDQLRIKTIFSNTARYTQAYPVLSIKLSGHDNEVTAMRRFQPHEYLAEHIDINAGLPAKTAVEVFIDIVKPSAPVVSYQFDFM